MIKLRSAREIHSRKCNLHLQPVHPVHACHGDPALGSIIEPETEQSTRSWLSRGGQEGKVAAASGMGSPKAAKSMVKQRIWRHRLVAPFAAVLITAVVVFSGLFAQDPSGELDSYSLAASASFFSWFFSPLSPNLYVFLLEFIGTRSHLGVHCRECG